MEVVSTGTESWAMWKQSFRSLKGRCLWCFYELMSKGLMASLVCTNTEEDGDIITDDGDNSGINGDTMC